MKRTTTLASIVILLLACVGCGLQDPYNRPEGPTASVPRAPSSAPSTRTSPTGEAAPVSEGAAGSPAQVLYEFAQAYGNVTAGKPGVRRETLKRLATAQFERAFGRTAARASSDELPNGASLSSVIVNVDLAPQRGRQRSAAVALQQRVIFAGDRAERPTTDLFVAELVRTAEGWRVAAFSPQR